MRTRIYTHTHTQTHTHTNTHTHTHTHTLTHTGSDMGRCLSRAREWHIYCNNSRARPVTATFVPTHDQYTFPESHPHTGGAARCNVLQSMLQYVAVCCNVREICSHCVCVSSDNLSRSRSIYHPNTYSLTHPGLHTLYKQTTHTLQDSATVYCKVLPPTLCNTLQHTATL